MRDGGTLEGRPTGLTAAPELIGEALSPGDNSTEADAEGAASPSAPASSFARAMNPEAYPATTRRRHDVSAASASTMRSPVSTSCRLSLKGPLRLPVLEVKAERT
jgi:hypothetical protein